MRTRPGSHFSPIMGLRRTRMPEAPPQTGPSEDSEGREEFKKGRGVRTKKVGWKEDLKYQDLEC